MPQDSGAFKTIPRDCSRFGLVRAFSAQRCKNVTAAEKRRAKLRPRQRNEFLTNGFPRLRYSEFSLIRSDLAVAAAGEADDSACRHRVPRWLKGLRNLHS